MKYLFPLLFLILSCSSIYKHQLVNSKNTVFKENKAIDWFLKDPFLDSLPGISLYRANDFLRKKKKESVIVAVMDRPVDIEHEVLKDKIWINHNEIPQNNIDDDKNGYIDDVYGWNFLGKKNLDSMLLFANTEAMRIIRKFKKDSTNNKIEIDSFSKRFKSYNDAKNKYQKEKEKAIKRVDYTNLVVTRYDRSVKNLNAYFNNKKYGINELEAIKTEDKILKQDIALMLFVLKKNIHRNEFLRKRFIAHHKLKKTLDFNYKPRHLIGDNFSDNLKYINYGSNAISTELNINFHGTIMGALIAANKNSYIPNGIVENVKLMTLVVAPQAGDEHDKDIALGIHYAVDNGAKVINMSFSKDISEHSNWVFEAIKYANSKNVLLVTSAGNEGNNGDLEKNLRYPNDCDYDMPEVADNFLVVGATSSVVDSTFVCSFSNYGKKQVDVFAPGKHIKAAYPNNTYMPNSIGTSQATAIVSGIASLLFSYYPKLTASQLKKIIMESGISYDLEVSVGKKRKEKFHFSELSKSGKVVNAYNAVLLAELISKGLSMEKAKEKLSSIEKI